MWFLSFKDIFVGVYEFVEVGKVGNFYYVLKFLLGRFRKVSFFFWGDEKDIFGVIGWVGEIGFKSVLMVLDEKIVNVLSMEKKGKVLIIVKWF